MRKITPTLLLLAAPLGALLGPSSALAGQVVHFTDGRSLEVAQIEDADTGGWVELTFEGGGVMAVPASRISGFAETRPRSAANPAARRSAAPARPANRASGSDRWTVVAGEWADVLASAAERNGVDPVLLAAVAHVESRFNPQAISPKGAQGMLQLMPQTAARFGVHDAMDPSQNVEGGAKYLRWLLDRFDGRTDLALAGYNAGENAVDKHQGIPPYRETQHYVRSVLRYADRLAGRAR